MTLTSATGVLVVVWGVSVASWVIVVLVLALRPLMVSLSNHVLAILSCRSPSHARPLKTPDSRLTGGDR